MYRLQDRGQFDIKVLNMLTILLLECELHQNMNSTHILYYNFSSITKIYFLKYDPRN